MSRLSLTVARTTCALSLLLGGTQTRADILDDIWSVVQQARDRATQARDRATQARDGVTAVRTRIDTAVATFSTTIQSFVNESVEDLTREINAELQGRAAFVNNAAECSQFRGRIVQMLTEVEATSNAILRTSPCVQGLQVDFSREITLVQELPCRLLYPLYRLLDIELHLFDSDLLDCLRQAANDLTLAAEFFAEDLQSAGTDDMVLDARGLLNSQMAKNAWTLERVTRLQKAASSLSGLSIVLKIIGKGLVAGGETQFNGEAQIHGYVGGSIQNNRKKKFGEAMVGISDAIKGVSDFLTNKTRFAITLSTQHLILTTMEANQKKILDNQDRILAALGAGPASPGSPIPGTCGVATMTMLPLMTIGFFAIRVVRKRRNNAQAGRGEQVTI